MMSRLTRTEWLVAIVGGGWVVAFDAHLGWAYLAIGILLVPVLLLLRRHPVVAAFGALAALAAHWALAGSTESPSILAPALASAFALGRYASLVAAVGWTLLNVALLLVVEDGASALFAAFLLGGPVTFGRLVRRRTLSARTAEQLRAEAVARDPAAVAERVVAAERVRLAHDTVGLVRNAVASMQAAAVRARDGLVRDELAQIQTLGRTAITDLRRLLGLLRDDEPTPAAAVPSRRAPWRVDLAVAVGLAALAAAETVGSDAPPTAIGTALAIIAAASVALRRTDPALACLVATAATAPSFGLHAPMIGGFWSAMLALLLAWTVGRSGSGRAWGTLAVFAVVRVIHTHLYAPGNEPVEIAFFAMGALAGYLWAERERVERSALAEVNSIDANTSAVVEAAVREERRRVARELHDVTSHAVGVMVVQAGAALTLAGSDPLAADQAVAEIDRAGAQALAELTTLSRILARDPATESGVEPADSDELMALIERMAAGGLRITHALAEVRNDEVGIARTTYRVIQEALTNALRHARYSAVHVSTARDEAGLDITVTNDRPPATGGPPAQESGFGLIGLTERVRSLGGTMSAGPSPTGGFAVHVHLPLTRPEPLMAER